jgi:hypothetical protein
MPTGGWELRQDEQCSFAGTDTTYLALENTGAGIAYLDLPIRTVVNFCIQCAEIAGIALLAEGP